jgi:membrane dipeptidase
VTAPRASLAAAACAAALLTLPLARGDEPPAPVMVVDLHVDLPWQVHVKGRSDALTEGHTRLEALRRGHYGGLVLPIYLPDKIRPEGPSVADAEAVLSTIERITAKHDIFLPLRSPLAQPGRISTWLAIEGAGAFAADLDALDRFIDRGVRLVGPAHQANTAFASSATGARVAHGLTPLGKEMAARVYARGALIDVSHLSDAAFADVAAIAREHGAPIVATHSSARALAPSPRNLTDEQLRAIAGSGGVAGVNFHAPFVRTGDAVTLDDVAAQVEHMVRVAGVDHVAIGSDFDGGIRAPEGLEDASKLADLARLLEQRGMARADVLKVFSLNALRVLAFRGDGSHGRGRVPTTTLPTAGGPL